VSGWQVAAGPIGRPAQRYAAYTSGLAVMIVLVGVLKLAGAAVALAAVLARPGWPRRWLQLLGVALWGAFGLLGLYSAGNLAITVGTVSGLLAPSAAWTAAGGVTAKAIGYVLFFLGGAALFGVLAVWFHRRHHLGWTSAVAGLAGAPLLLALLLAVAPAILGQWGCCCSGPSRGWRSSFGRRPSIWWWSAPSRPVRWRWPWPPPWRPGAAVTAVWSCSPWAAWRSASSCWAMGW
jgi:hypothetical protein